MGLTPLSDFRPEPTVADRFWRPSGRPVSDGEDPLQVVETFLQALRQHGSDGVAMLQSLRRREVDGDLTYASPEQARGEPVDERSVVFSVGVLLFERLTRRHPFGADRESQEKRLRRGELASGVNYFPRIPAELRAVVVKAIAAFPEERWNNLSDLRRQLEGFLKLAQMPEARRVMQTRSLPAIPERPQTHDMDPLTGDFELHSRFEVTNTGPYPKNPADDNRPGAASGLTREVDIRRKNKWIPVVWMACGALVALTVLVLTQAEDRATTPAEADTDSAAHPRAETAPVAPKARASDSATEADKLGETEEDLGLVISADAPDSPAAGGFDMQLGGERALAAATTCFSPARLRGHGFYFGASLLYDKRTGTSKKVYLGGTRNLSKAEKYCVRVRLKGLSAGGPPAKNTMVIYNFTVAGKKRSFKAHVQ